MSYLSGPRRGRVWEDLRTLDRIIREPGTHFFLSGKNEREFETQFSGRLAGLGNSFHGPIISQFDRTRPVRSVHVFGKKHRPDLTIGEDGIAVEMKFVSGSLDGVKQAVGQSLFYRIGYRFVVNIHILDEGFKNLYHECLNGEELGIERIFRDLAEDKNVFNYIVPAFKVGTNVRKVVEWNDLEV